MALTKISRQTPLRQVLELGKPAECSKHEKCRACCAFGTGFVITEDIKRISDSLKLTEEEFKKQHLQETKLFGNNIYKIKTINKDNKQYGRCSFFDEENGCKIHEVKPLHCRIAYCNENGEALHQWFMLNYIVDKNNPDSIREWDYYVKTTDADVIAGGKPEDIVPDKEELKKMLSYVPQQDLDVQKMIDLSQKNHKGELW